LSDSLSSGLSPAAKQLPELTVGLQKTLTNANKLLRSLDSGYGDNTKFNRDMDRLRGLPMALGAAEQPARSLFCRCFWL
jgi:hypothetical protein